MDKKDSSLDQNSASNRYGRARPARRPVWRSLLPVLIGLAFVVLGALLVLVYRSGDENADEGTGSPGVIGPGNLGVAASFTLPAVDGEVVSLDDLTASGNVLLFFNEGVM